MLRLSQDKSVISQKDVTFTSKVTLDPGDTVQDVRGTEMTGGPKTKIVTSIAFGFDLISLTTLLNVKTWYIPQCNSGTKCVNGYQFAENIINQTS